MKLRLLGMLLTPIIFVLMSGCTSMEKCWKDAETQNTRESYTRFTEQYPSSELVSEARMRVDSADYAFLTTCQIGTLESFQGFAGSHSTHCYVPLARSRIEFLSETNRGDIDSYKQFIKKHPDNPFTVEAKASIPILWLREFNEPIGVEINVDSASTWRGIFKGKQSKDELRKVLFNDLKNKYFKEEGINVRLIEDQSYVEKLTKSDSVDSISTMITLNYVESMIEQTRGGAVGNMEFVIASLLRANVKESYRFTIKNAITNNVYCSDIRSLDQIVNTNDMLYFLDRFAVESNIVPTILVAVANKDVNTRWKAVATLAHVKNSNDLEYQLGILRGDIKKMALEALTRSGIADCHIIEPIISSIEDRNIAIFIRAIRALGAIKDSRAVEPLIEILKDDDGDVREAAATALRRLEDIRAVEPLVEALKDVQWPVRKEAAMALGQLNDSRAIEPLIETLKDDDWDVREAVSRALGQLDDARAVEPLIKTLKDPQWSVREEAALALGQLKDSRAVEPLIEALKDDDRDVREASATALRRLEDAHPDEPLIKSLKIVPSATEVLYNKSISILNDQLKITCQKKKESLFVTTITLSFDGVIGVDKHRDGSFNLTSLKVNAGDKFYIQSYFLFLQVEVAQTTNEGITLTFQKQ